MLSPVLFSEALHNLLSSTNVSCFVEVGPRSILTNFFRDHDFKNIGCIDVMMNEECPMETYLKAVKQLLPPISRAPTFNHVAFSFWQPTPPEPVLYTTEWEHIQTSASSSSVSSRDVAINMVESPLTEFFSKVSAAVERVQVIFTNEQDCGSRSVNGTTTWNTVALGSSVDLLEGLNYLISALKCAFEQSCCLLVVTEGVLGGNSWRGAWILGFLRSARIEFVGLDINYIDFCSDLTLAESTMALSYILNNKNRGVEMVVNPGPILKIARLIPMSIDFLKNSDGSLNFPSCATYIISGGLGALGLRAAQTLIKNGACHLILLSRSGVPSCSESQHLLSSLQEVKNVKIICMACDISTDVGIKALKAITRSCLTVKGIVHAAGVMTEPDSILNTSLASLERTISPKLQGAWNLHLMSLQEGWKLDFFVVYSSASGILGFGGQSSYAASNTALDALVKLRRGQKLCGTSLQWGEWGIGMGTKTMKSDKVVQITPQMGSSILEAALAHPDTSPPEILVLPSQNWGDYTHLLRQEHLPLFAKVLVSSETPQELDISSSQCNVSHITNDKNWLEYMCEMAARIAGQPVNPTDKLVTIMDSLAQMEFYHRLNDALVEAGCERLKRNFLSMGIYSLEGILASISTSAEGNNSSSSPSQREEEAFTVKPGDCPSEIEASYEQTQMYLIHMLMPDKSTYNQLLGVRLRNAPVDIDTICYALDMVWGRHDVLRVALRMVSPPPQYVIMQYVKSVSEAPHFQLKLCEAVDGASLTQTLRDALQEPLNMEEGPLIWARLVTVSPEDVTLILVIHHAICDAHSCKSIISEIMTVYSDRIGGRESSLELRAVIQYSDYAVAQRKWLDPNGERFLNYLTYWKNKLADLKPIDLPLDRPRAPVLSNRGAVIHVSVPFNVISALLKVCHAKSCTLFVGITSLWGLLIARCSGDASEVVVGMPYNSRNHEMYEMQGDVINLLPLRLNFGGDSTFGGILERANKDVQDAVKHGDGFAGVVMRLGIVPDPSRTPLFDTVLILQDNRVSTDNMKADVLSKVGACEVEIISRGHPFMDEISRSSFEISCEFTTPEPGSDMKGVITYNPDLFDDISIQKIADSYVTILDEAGKLGLRSNVWNLPLLN